MGGLGILESSENFNLLLFYVDNTFQSSLAISIAESKHKIYFQFCWLLGNSGMQSIVFHET